MPRNLLERFADVIFFLAGVGGDTTIEGVLEAIAANLELKNKQLIVVAANKLKREGFRGLSTLVQVRIT